MKKIQIIYTKFIEMIENMEKTIILIHHVFHNV
jgi:hypothetical protein